MKRLKSNIILLLKLLLVTGVSMGQSVPKPVDQASLISATELLARQALNFKMLDSIEYNLSSDVTSELGNDAYHVNLHWLEKGDQFRYRWEQLDKTSPMKTEVAFDGNLFQEFPPGVPLGFVMEIKKGICPTEIRLFEDQFLSSPYSFVRSGTGLPFRYLHDLADPKTFTALDLVDSDPSVVQKDGEKYLCLSFKAGIDSNWGKPQIRRVYFSENNGYYPMISELVCEGAVIGRYKVSELGIIQVGANHLPFMYPKQAQVLYYGYGTPPNISEKPSAVYNYKLTDVKLNQVEDGSFTLDPSSVSRIWDVDHKVYINVPK